MSYFIVNGCGIIMLILAIISVTLYNMFYLSDINCITTVNSSYTYIIVGAGTAGCVLAARLTEEPANTVLLIEAGAHFNILSKYPLLATMLQKSKHDWLYETVSQRWSSRGFFEQKQAVPRGKGLGGTALMNFMMHEIDFEAVSFIQNLQHTSKFKGVDDIQSYYLDLFTNKQRNIEIEKLGYLQVSNSTLSQLLQRAVVQLNMSHVEYKPSYSTIHNGERWTSYHSYLIPASKRPNLHVLCSHEVVQITFENKSATGVVARDSNDNYKTIHSDKEIILAAGAINSPKLLLLSGIGNKSELHQLKIPTIADVPSVGLNLHDHFQIPLYVSITQPLSLTLSKMLQFNAIYDYVFHRKGVLSESPIAGTVRLKPNVNLILFGIGSTDEGIFRKIGNYMSDTFRNIFPFHTNVSREGFVFLAGCGRPKSRGYVKLKDNEPKSYPFINPRYLQNRDDVKCIVNAVKLTKRIIATTTFRNIGAKLHWPQFRQCRRYVQRSTNIHYIKCIIRVAAITSYHQAGTCKLGKPEVSSTVVDNTFRVKGVQGLRIVDASVLPTSTYSFPNAVVIALAELAAALVRLS